MGSLSIPEGDPSFHVGQRLSYDGALCTVRYHGALPGTKGVWLGVEWDEVGRGKHDGTYQGRRYFHCLSSEPTAGSFIRPSRTRDPPRSFLDALRFKYAAEDTHPSVFSTPSTVAGSPITNGNVIEISGKVVEEVGFERIRQQQAVLQNLRIVLLDGLCLSGITLNRHDPGATAAAQEAVVQTCPDLVELDIGWNLLETWTDVAEICLPLKKLQVLKASGLRLNQLSLPQELEEKQPFRHVAELHINEDLLQPEQIAMLVGSVISGLPRFPALKLLSLSQNRLSHLQDFSAYRLDLHLPSVKTLILDNNLFTSLAFLPNILQAFPGLKELSLQGNQINRTGLSSDLGLDKQALAFPQIESLNLSHNLIQDYSFIDDLARMFPRLTSLRVSNNPFFTVTSIRSLVRDEALNKAKIASSTSNAPPGRVSGLPGTSRSDTAYSLTLARIPTLLILNHSTITLRDREEGEIYYTSLAERELSVAIARIPSGTRNLEPEFNELKKRYPRYQKLCQKYDRDSVFDTQKASKSQAAPKNSGAHLTYAPGTLGARLIQTHFYIPSPTNPTGEVFAQTARSAAGEPPPGTTTTFSRLIPRTISVYTLKALLARTFDLPALQFRLIYQSPELDPVMSQRGSNEKATWEAWGDWDLDHPPQKGVEKEGNKWKRREVEIMDGTREWGFYVEDRATDVTIRVEPFPFAGTGPGTGEKS